MLLYRYPPKMSVHEKRVAVLNAKNEAKGIKKRAAVNFILAAAMIFLAVFSGKLIAVLLVSLVAAYTAFIGFALLRLSKSGYNESLFTEIYDDRLVHLQQSFFSGKIKRFCIVYEEIEKSFQDRIGNLVIIKNNDKEKIILRFCVPDAKYFLIRELEEKIKYKKHSAK
ncbi:MAG: hypothetical protein WC900_08960 [Oscillospiraceae bacterium]